MNAVTTTDDQSHARTMESVLADGDLGKLTAEQRVAYYLKVCESLGLNPYTRPFDYITLNGKKVLYAKRDCTDQLRRIRGITLTVTDKHQDDDLFLVTVRATEANGRSDEDFGAVPMMNLKGEARANAMLKAITKAKRRVTLSICGMGMNDEAELEHMPGAVIENIELPAPPRTTTTIAPRAPTERTDQQWQAWLDKLRASLAVLYRRSEVEDLASKPTVADAIATAPGWVRHEIDAHLAEAYGRFPDAVDDGSDAHEPVTEEV